MIDVSELRIWEPSGPVLLIRGADGEDLVRVERDLSLVFGGGYEPDRAARMFWEALAARAVSEP